LNPRIPILLLNWQVLMKIYFLKLHWQILFTKIDEEPYMQEYTASQLFTKSYNLQAQM